MLITVGHIHMLFKFIDLTEQQVCNDRVSPKSLKQLEKLKN